MNISEKLDRFIAENGGNERDSLNVALARLEACEKEKEYWRKEVAANNPAALADRKKIIWAGETYYQGEGVEVSSNGEMYVRRTLDKVIVDGLRATVVTTCSQHRYMRKIGSAKTGDETAQML